MTFAPILFVFTSVVSTTQEPPPPMAPPPPPGLPIDGAVIFVLVLGLLYGVYKKRSLLKAKQIH
jgi:hypothetical protein